jgi:hypothetical protein
VYYIRSIKVPNPRSCQPKKLPAADGGFGFDLRERVESPVLPAGQGREGHGLAGRVLEAIERFSPLPGGVLLVRLNQYPWIGSPSTSARAAWRPGQS